ncbi:hypothetical protein HKX48_002826 [Thoreauomyces humboldtii]|nr:hypothetical protein HKX48_002826 [Thoreauomyces humboldtii]
MPGLQASPGVSTTSSRASSNIWIAAAEGGLELIEHLLQHGGPNDSPLSPNVKDENGYTPLHAAASYSHLPLIDLLVTTHGADVNITDSDGDTPLHMCETRAAAEKLVTLGCDVNVRNDEGKLAIEVADEDEREEVVAYLREFHPDFTPTVPADEAMAPEEFAHLFQNALAEAGCVVDADEQGNITVVNQNGNGVDLGSQGGQEADDDDASPSRNLDGET